MPSTRETCLDLLDNLLKRYSFAAEEVSVNDKSVVFSAFKDSMLAHLHESWEFKVMLGGTRRAYLSGECRERVCAPHLQLLAPRTVHFTDGPANMSRDCCYLNCCFEGENIWLASVGKFSRTGMYLDSAKKAEWRRLLDGKPELVAARIAKYRQTGHWLGNAASAGALRLFFATLGLALKNTAASSRENERTSPAELARNYIVHNYHEPTLTVEETAKHAGVTPNHLAALYRKTYGITVRQAIVCKRMEKARQLLADGEYSVKETAWLTGWRNQFYFSNSFKAFYGFPPSATLGSVKRRQRKAGNRN